MKAFVFAFLISTLLTTNSQDVIPVSNTNNITITYGSCLNTFNEDSDIELVLNSIIRTQPDLWMFVGDAVYLDGQNFFFGVLPGPGYDVADGAYVQSVFNSLKDNPNYVALTNSIPVVGTWDDHDYAYNDADETFEYKERNKGFYLDFIGEPADSPRREQQGIYDSYYIGEDKLVKVILLDVRYSKEPESLQTSILGADTTSHFDDMLGEEQWTWLDAQLQDPNGVYTLIVSAIQFIPNDRPVLPNWYKNSLDRFIGLINKHQKSGVVLLSGDVHFAEMLQHPCPNIVGYRSFHEFTSSGLTHSAFFLDFIDELFPTYSREPDRYFGKNFGMVRFERPEGSISPPNLVFEARNAEGNLVLRREVLYSDLVYDAALAASYTGCVLPGPDDELSDLDEVFGKRKGGA